MAFDTLIFTLADVRLVRKSVSINIDDFDMYAQEVQRNYLEKLLGAKLYAAMLAAPAEARFVNLIDGVNYDNGGEIIFRGVKLYCSYLWLHLYAGMGGVNHTPIGNALFKDDNSNQGEASKYQRNAAAHYIGSADGLEGSILDYLTFSASTFPEFSESKQIEQASEDNVNFKVIGNKYSPPNNFY